MNTKSRLKSLVAVAALLAVPAAADLAIEPSASAYEVKSDSTSTPGSIVPAGAMIIGTILHEAPAFKTLGVTVGATTQKDVAQRVQVSYFLQVRSSAGTWSSVSNNQGTWKDVAGDGTAAFGAWTAKKPGTNTANDYRITYGITWVDAETSETIARATVTPNDAGDTACTFSGCTKYDDHVHV